MQRARQGVAADDRAVTEVLGQVLLVVSFVAVAGILYVLIEPPGPAPELHVDLQTTLVCVDGTWGNADDVLRIDHLGGQALFTNQTKIVVSVNGTETSHEGMGLGGPFADGAMTIGEHWNHTTPLPVGATVSADVVYTHDDGSTELRDPKVVRLRCG